MSLCGWPPERGPCPYCAGAAETGVSVPTHFPRWPGVTSDATRPAAAGDDGLRHLLVLDGIEEEGHPVFRVVCPAVGDEGCPELPDPDDAPGYCVVADQFANIGREIIRGSARGSGPWLVDVEWEWTGEDSEMWIDLVEEETEPALPVDWVVSA